MSSRVKAVHALPRVEDRDVPALPALEVGAVTSYRPISPWYLESITVYEILFYFRVNFVSINGYRVIDTIC